MQLAILPPLQFTGPSSPLHSTLRCSSPLPPCCLAFLMPYGPPARGIFQEFQAGACQAAGTEGERGPGEAPAAAGAHAPAAARLPPPARWAAASSISPREDATAPAGGFKFMWHHLIGCSLLPQTSTESAQERRGTVQTSIASDGIGENQAWESDRSGMQANLNAAGNAARGSPAYAASDMIRGNGGCILAHAPGTGKPLTTILTLVL